MNASQITFGVEFETLMPQSDATPIGAYHCGLPVAWLPAGWKVEKDGSLKPGINQKGAEFVSPKLVGSAGLAEVMAAAASIAARGGAVNDSCGLHVTVTFPCFCSPVNVAALARLISLVANFEKAIYASTGTHKRERAVYCKPLKQYRTPAAAADKAKFDRYHILNLYHLARGQNRIEFRCFAGTLNATKVAGYIQLVLGLVSLALNATRCCQWDYAKPAGVAKSAWDRNGALAGETDLVRLFYKLGWIKGHSNVVWGDLTGGGVAGLKSVKAKLLSLAQKYDQNS